MAIIDVTNNGVTFNDASASAANGDAIEDILETQASDGDTILFPFDAGDVCWVAANDKTAGHYPIRLDVDQGLAQTVTIQGKTDGNGEPLGAIKLDPDHQDFWRVIQVDCRGGWTADWADLRIDGNFQNQSGSPGYCAWHDNPSAGHSNDITWTNCEFLNAAETAFKMQQTNGIHLNGCSVHDTENRHGISVDHDSTTEVTPVCTIKNCYIYNIGTNGLNPASGIDSHPGRSYIENTVVDDGCKMGETTDGSNLGWDVELNGVRISGADGDGWQNITGDGQEVSLILSGDVLIKNSQEFGLTLRDKITLEMQDGTTLYLLKNGQDGSSDNLYTDFTNDPNINAANATVEACGAGGSGVDYNSGASSSIGTIVGQDNGGNLVDNNGNLTVGDISETDCATDPPGVPTSDDVGIGTVSTAAATRYGKEYDTVLNAVDDLGLDNTGGSDIIPTLQSNVQDNTLVEFPNGIYLVDGKLNDNGANNFGISGLGSDPTDVTFVAASGVSRRWIDWEDQTDLVLDNFAHDMGSGTDGILQVKIHISDGLEFHNIEWIGYWPDETETTVIDGSGANLLNFNIKSSSGSGVIDGMVRDGPTSLPDYPDGGQGIFAGTGHLGTMTIKNSRLANMPLHGIYASRCSGDVIVEDSTLRNVNGDMIRVSGTGSVVRRCTLEWDVANDDPGNVTTGTNGGEYPAGNNGIEIESGFQTYSGADVTDNTFTVLSTENSQGCLMLDGSCGGCTFSGNEYDIQADIPIIYVRAVGDSIHSNVDDAPPTPHDVTIQNETVVTTAGLGSAGTAVIDIAGRDGSTVDGVCVEAADPPDGVRFDGTQSATVSDSTLNVAGTAVVTVNGASVSTSNVSTTGACTLTGGTGTSLGNIVTAGGNVQTAGGNVQTGG